MARHSKNSSRAGGSHFRKDSPEGDDCANFAYFSFTPLGERVATLNDALDNARQEGDEVLFDELFETLLILYRQQARVGAPHPCFTQILADHILDPSMAIAFYHLAMRDARAIPDETTYDKMIRVAERFMDLGRWGLAEAYLHEGRARAVCAGSADWVQEADSLLDQLPRKENYGEASPFLLPESLFDFSNTDH